MIKHSFTQALLRILLHKGGDSIVNSIYNAALNQLWKCFKGLVLQTNLTPITLGHYLLIPAYT